MSRFGFCASPRRWVLLCVLATALLCPLSSVAATAFVVVADEPQPPTVVVRDTAYLPPMSAQTAAVLRYEEPADEIPAVVVQPVTPPVSTPREKTGGGRPRVAIIIDDMGQNREIGLGFLGLDIEISFSFLPYGPHTLAQSHRARELGRDVLLHLPLEPTDSSIDPGPGAVYLRNYSSLLSGTLLKNLQLVPGAVGVNNHMGSRFTANRQAMTSLLQQIQKRGLFFVDSVTSGGSVGYDVARGLALPTARRHVFLDHSLQRAKIKRQVETLIALARSQGFAIAIGHPHPETLDILRQMLPRLRREVVVTPVHKLVH